MGSILKTAVGVAIGLGLYDAAKAWYRDYCERHPH